MRGSTRVTLVLAGIAVAQTTGFTAGAAAPAAPPTFSGHCPLDVIFPISVDAARARVFVPDHYSFSTAVAGKALMFISLVACDNTIVAGVAGGAATYHDLLFQIDTPPGGGTPGVDHSLDAYWAWLLTNNASVHESLTALGMFQPFDSNMSLTASSGVGGVTTLQGHVSWPDSPFSLQGTMLDTAPPGVPPDYQVQFWQDVPAGVLLAKLQKHGETWRYANFTVSTPLGSKLASVLGDQCTPATDGATCSVSGQGTVTNLTNFTYDIAVLGQTPSSNVPEFPILAPGMGLAVVGAGCAVVVSRRRRRGRLVPQDREPRSPPEL